MALASAKSFLGKLGGACSFLMHSHILPGFDAICDSNDLDKGIRRWEIADFAQVGATPANTKKAPK